MAGARCTSRSEVPACAPLPGRRARRGRLCLWGEDVFAVDGFILGFAEQLLGNPG